MSYDLNDSCCRVVNKQEDGQDNGAPASGRSGTGKKGKHLVPSPLKFVYLVTGGAITLSGE